MRRIGLYLSVILLVAAIAPAFPATASTSAHCGNPRLPAGDYTERDWPLIQHKPDGTPVARTFNIHVPPQVEHQAVPVVFDLHGALSNKTEQDTRTRLRDKGKEAGFLTIQPDSWPHWTTSAKDEAERGLSDIEFARRLLDTATEHFCVDPSRIYAVGFSSGGLMSTILACAGVNNKLGDYRLVAIGVVAAAPIPDAHTGGICPSLAQQPIPTRVVFSHNDQTLAWLCCQGNVESMTAQVHSATSMWARENGCTGASTTDLTGRTGWGVLTQTVRHQCPAGNSVIVDTFDTGSPLRNGHVWPGAAYGGEYATTDVLWNFLSQYSL
ncbi:MAG: hypothetical protein HOQ05_06965 [Corynebacteriales bacterium]|nr:hypothetical protein [Mycobacteriales bacterium]